ncbi:hypothetical protein L0222_11705, partial [bacterium]|nr:hypothetical protein [bacterium]
FRTPSLPIQSKPRSIKTFRNQYNKIILWVIHNFSKNKITDNKKYPVYPPIRSILRSGLSPMKD